MDKDISHAVGFKKGNTHESDFEIESDDSTSTSPATTRKPISTASSHAVCSKKGNTHEIELDNSPATTSKQMDKDSSHAVGFKKGNTHESDSELESESDDTPYTTPATTRKPLNNHLNFTNAHASSSSNTANNTPLPTREEFSNIMIRLRELENRPIIRPSQTFIYNGKLLI